MFDRPDKIIENLENQIKELKKRPKWTQDLPTTNGKYWFSWTKEDVDLCFLIGVIKIEDSTGVYFEINNTNMGEIISRLPWHKASEHDCEHARHLQTDLEHHGPRFRLDEFVTFDYDPCWYGPIELPPRRFDG